MGGVEGERIKLLHLSEARGPVNVDVMVSSELGVAVRAALKADPPSPHPERYRLTDRFIYAFCLNSDPMVCCMTPPHQPSPGVVTRQR